MIGFLLSVSFFGQVSDCVGRFPTLIMCYVITTTSMFLSLLSESYTMFIILRFFQAFGRTGITAVGYVLLMETAGPNYREGIGIAIQLGWAVGYVLLPGVAYFIRHWFWFQLFVSLCFLPFLVSYKFIPESPRWLASRGRTKKLEKVLINAAAVNGKEFKGDIRDLDIFENNKEMKEKKAETIFEVLKRPNMRSRIFKMIYLWMVHTFLYYGVSYNTNDLAGNPYFNFFIAGAMEFPCRGIVFFILKKLGRKPIIVLFMTVCGLAFGAMIFIPTDLPWLSTTFAMVGKFCVTASFALLYLYTTEMFPTGVRNVSFGTCSMCARIGSILAPFVRELGKATHPSIPNVLYALLALSCTLLTLFLPETRGLKMPDSLQEGEDLGRIPDKKKESTEPNPPASEVTSHM
ncbi:Organic cation transporter protein like [Argiope bruennichi]|uniref:Organic cation transporter protein like n=1 Tax=Argiope bruennichi TaxID=94029 RepID=A0A8T0G241_ARGBR|nr:Organic cation transporter protein like [Argiope bruennichi]